MALHQLNQYLACAKTYIHCKSIDYLVLGNEAADLDSMASAIVYAYLMTAGEQDKTIIPLIPIPRADFKLRTEAVYVFGQAGIDLNNLVFLDELNIEEVMQRVTGLVLVDHNRLSCSLDQYKDKVAIILDHHSDENLYPHVSKRVIEPVGSTATLVGEKLFTHHSDLIDAHLALLLCGTILLDTVNMDPAAGRVTSKDEKIADSLMQFCPLGRELYFNRIQKAKFNTIDLCSFDLLRRDYKKFQFGKILCGIASVLLPLTQWGQKDRALCLEFESYAQRQSLDLLLSMNAYSVLGFNRELAVYCTDPYLHDNLIEFFQEKKLELTPVKLKDQTSCPKGKISFYRQGNLGISRKKLSPLLDDYFTS